MAEPNSVRSTSHSFSKDGVVSLLIRTARLQFLAAGLALFLLGSLLAVNAGSRFNLLRFLLGCLVALPAQLAVNLSNDYFDAGTDRRGGETLISGGSGILLAHPELKKPVMWLALGSMGLSILVGLIFILSYHYPLWLFGLVLMGNLLGWYYSAPPLRFSIRGLGEIVFLFNVAVLLPALGYLVIRGRWDLPAFSFQLPFLCYIMAFIFCVEIPDMDDDIRAGKMTWLTRMGRRTGFVLVGCLTLLATIYFYFAEQFFPHQGKLDFIVVALLSFLPLAAGLTGMIRRPREWKPATVAATTTIIAMTAFIFLVDGYLIYLL